MTIVILVIRVETMNNIKTAISIEAPLLQRANALASELNISRSRLIALALEEFLQQYDNAKLLESINAVYGQPPSLEEQKEEDLIREAMLRIHYELVADEPW
jgi:metal-responsive CopG/Arc/MetJ family transcriptional regulator